MKLEAEMSEKSWRSSRVVNGFLKSLRGDMLADFSCESETKFLSPIPNLAYSKNYFSGGRQSEYHYKPVISDMEV